MRFCLYTLLQPHVIRGNYRLHFAITGRCTGKNIAVCTKVSIQWDLNISTLKWSTYLAISNAVLYTKLLSTIISWFCKMDNFHHIFFTPFCKIGNRWLLHPTKFVKLEYKITQNCYKSNIVPRRKYTENINTWNCTHKKAKLLLTDSQQYQAKYSQVNQIVTQRKNTWTHPTDGRTLWLGSSPSQK